MEAAAAIRCSPAAPALATRCRLGSGSKTRVSAVSFATTGGTILMLRQRLRQLPASRSRVVTRASSESQSPEPSSNPIAPLRMESAVGQFLSQILVSHPHLLPAAVDQQLQQLHTNQAAEKDKGNPTPSGSEIVLYRRIAEVKEKERKRTLEEILYALVVQKFVEAGVSLVPELSRSVSSSGVVGLWESDEGKLERLHSPDVSVMIENHLHVILGGRQPHASAVAPLSKLMVGQVYAASVMYGYFLKRVDQRFQLEKSVKGLLWEPNGAVEGMTVANLEVKSTPPPTPHPEVDPELLGTVGGSSSAIRPSRLRSYVMSMDSETLQRFATIRSKEAFGIIEKHTEALFGRPEIVITRRGTVDVSKDEIINISFAGLKRLVLEAVTFGSFLWDVESYVDTRYHFVTN